MQRWNTLLLTLLGLCNESDLNPSNILFLLHPSHDMNEDRTKHLTSNYLQCNLL